jgi:hypothetical protein
MQSCVDVNYGRWGMFGREGIANVANDSEGFD